jgi:ankyrin repeat protein
MWSGHSLLKRLKINAFSFALTFVLSVAISSFYPSFRDFVSWHAQYQLCQAAAHGHLTKTRLLVMAGANANGWNTTYQPLHFAARYGQTETARILLDAGAEVNSIGTWKQTPLMEALQGRHIRTARLLLSRGASVEPLDSNSGTALWQATRAKDAESVRLLMSYGARNCKDAESALAAAVESNDRDSTQALLDGGIDPRGVTATHLLLPLTKVAANNQQPEIVRMLRAAGAE